MTWFILIAAALLVGISKTSVGGLGSVSVALFALVMPAKESTAAILLLLIVGDLVAVARYRSHADWKLLVRLLPWVIPGLVLGAGFLRLVSNGTLKVVIGVVLLVMLAIQLLTRRTSSTEPAPWATTRTFSAGAGIAAGFTTMTANAAAPVMALFLLSQRVDKMKFVGTGAWYFLIINLTKVPFSAALGLFTKQSLLRDLVLAPVVLVGAALGVWLLKLLPQRVFEVTIILASALAAVSLLVT